MAANSKIQDFQTMINGLQTYMSSLQEHSQALKQAAETYNSGINDRSSNVYKKKIDAADFMIAAFIGNVLVMINEAGSIEDDMVVNMIFVNMGADHIFIFSL